MLEAMIKRKGESPGARGSALELGFSAWGWSVRGRSDVRLEQVSWELWGATCQAAFLGQHLRQADLGPSLQGSPGPSCPQGTFPPWVCWPCGRFLLTPADWLGRVCRS